MRNKKLQLSDNAKKDKGFALLETLLALALLMAVSLQLFSQQLEDGLDLTAVNQGKAMATAASSLNSTLGQYYGAWLNATPGTPMTVTLADGVTTATVADPSHPTILELSKLGFFPSNFSSTAYNNANYVVSITKVPAGCVTPNCNLDAYICLDKPILTSGDVGKLDGARLGLAVKTVGPDAGGSSLLNPMTISGLGGKWSIPNTIVSPPNQAGIMCVRAGFGSSAWAAFFRVDGTRWMTADANMGGNSVVNAKQLVTILKNEDDVCTDPGAISGGKDASGSEVSMICRAGKWKTQNGITANPGDACSPDGIRATSIAGGIELVCKNGKYVQLISLISKNVEVSRLLVADGQTVTKPACDVGGVPDYTAIINKLSVDVALNPPMQSQYITTVDNGNSWSVVLRLRANDGSEVSGNSYNLSAVMHLECKY